MSDEILATCVDLKKAKPHDEWDEDYKNLWLKLEKMQERLRYARKERDLLKKQILELRIET